MKRSPLLLAVTAALFLGWIGWLAYLAATTTQRYNLTGAGDPREVQAAAVTADLFDVLQVRPEIGHAFTAADERAPLALPWP